MGQFGNRFGELDGTLEIASPLVMACFRFLLTADRTQLVYVDRTRNSPLIIGKFWISFSHRGDYLTTDHQQVFRSVY